MPEQKASTPWSTRTVAEGGTDSPVGDLVPIPDKITPIVNTGFISLAGKYRGIPSDDLQFTFQDPEQALAAGASLFIDTLNMLQHDILIFAILDSSGNSINIDMSYLNNGVTAGTPYSAFEDVGITGLEWKSNDPGDLTGSFVDILKDNNEGLAATWQFYKIAHLRGTIGNIMVRSNEGSNAGTISTGFLRLV